MSLKSQQMMIVRRSEIPAITEIVVDGKRHGLGIHQDFRRHPVLASYLPEAARLSMSWVHLEPGEELAIHAHPTVSIIIVATGEGFSRGDCEGSFSDGDVIVVPSGARHGFVGAGTKGYWALSVQVEGEGLYEQASKARVSFESAGLERLLAVNAKLMDDHVSNDLFHFIAGSDVTEAPKRAKLLDTIQVWSTFYQRMVLLRSALTDHPVYRALANDHLAEEFGHDQHLAADRGDRLKAVWDPILESGSSWFAWKMMTLDDAAKTALVHLVLEGGSKVFHVRANPVMAKFDETKHFGVHDEADEGHFEMGMTALQGLSDKQYQYLETVVREGWDMLNLICARMATLARGDK